MEHHAIYLEMPTMRTVVSPHQPAACVRCRTRDNLLKNRPASLVALHNKLEKAAREYGGVEIVTRDRYALFRTTRIFADLTVMRDALRLVVHLSREVTAPYFEKTVRGDKRASHVIKLCTDADLREILPFLREAYDLAVSEEESSE